MIQNWTLIIMQLIFFMFEVSMRSQKTEFSEPAYVEGIFLLDVWTGSYRICLVITRTVVGYNLANFKKYYIPEHVFYHKFWHLGNTDL